MMATRVVTVSVGEPFQTGETCPTCLFDSVMAMLFLIDSRSPSFAYFCGRRCGRIKEA